MMNKKILYIGIILFVLGIAISFALPSAISPNVEKISIEPFDYAYEPITINNTGTALIIDYLSSNLTNFYFANSSGFAALKNLMVANHSILSEAKQLLGNGVIEIIPNSTSGAFPSASALNTTNKTSISSMAPGTYYLIYENLNNKTIQLDYTYEALSGASELSIFSAGIASFILFVAGIIIIILAFIIKPKAQVVQQQTKTQNEAEIDALYKKIEKNKKNQKQ
ncbi:MAG: hypothetical protein QXT36_03390 [Candidatus Micrarchaeaceae archaeon]